MTELRIYQLSGETIKTCKGFDEVRRILEPIGVSLEQWPRSACNLPVGASPEEVMGAYRAPIDHLMKRYGFESVDVISMRPDHPEKQALRSRFLAEHTHDDFEVRFFVGGEALFYIHGGDRVYGLLCGPGDLIAVPAGAPHWFDMGPSPDFQCIRFFTRPDGWVARYTGAAIAERFPRLEQPYYDMPQAQLSPVLGRS